MITWITTRVGKMLAAIALVVAAFFATFHLGRRSQRKVDQVRDLEGKIDAMKDRKEVERELETLDPDERLRRLDGWMRKTK